MQFNTAALLSSLGLFCLATSAQASDAAPQSRFGFAAQLDAEFGGDDLVEVTFTNGRSQTMHAGQGVGLNAGFHYRPENSKFDIVGTIGYKFVLTAASNADIRLVRVPIKLQGYYDFSNHWWVSAGPVWHTGVRFKGDGFLSDVDFADALGFTFQFGWRWFGVGYTNMSYEAQKPFKGNVDASNIGFYFQWRGR